MNQIGGTHYTEQEVEPWEVIRKNGYDYFTGNVLRYLMRHTKKNGMEDLLKAKHYLEYMIEHYGDIYVQTRTTEWQFPGLSTEDFPELRRSTSGPTKVFAEKAERPLQPLYPPHDPTS